MKTVYLAASAVLFVSLACGAGCSHTAAEPPPPEAPRVSVQPPVARELTDYEEFNGWMEAEQILEVRARVRGHIDDVLFTDGQMVEKGTPLFKLDPRPFESEIGRVKDTLKIYEAQQVAAAKDEARLKELFTKGGASQAQVDKAVADAAALLAQISATNNEIQRAELDLEYSLVEAEIAGRVGRALMTRGNLVNAGGSDPLLTTIVDIDPIRVYFNIDERSLLRYAKGLGIQGRTLTDVLISLKDIKAPFTFALDGQTDFANQGTLAFGDNRIDPSTGTLQLYGHVENANGKFLPGARVKVRLPIGKPHAELMVPETAILADQDQRYILIADAEKNVRRRNVTLGILTDDRLRAVKPAEKLPEGEDPAKWSVIVDNLQRARVNYPVQPEDAKAAGTGAGDAETAAEPPAAKPANERAEH